MRQNVEHLKNAKDNEEKEPQVSSTLIDSGPRNKHCLLKAECKFGEITQADSLQLTVVETSNNV